MRVEYAPAKLTLSLRVTGVGDDGYHLIEAEMVTLDLADTLLFGPGTGVEVIPLVHTPRFEPTLVTRALEAVGRDAFVRLEKRIPVGAGLGGGSADAAAVLRWAGCDDIALALSLGADVPFCLVGGRAMVRAVETPNGGVSRVNVRGAPTEWVRPQPGDGRVVELPPGANSTSRSVRALAE